MDEIEFEALPSAKRVAYVLGSWRQLNECLALLTEREVSTALTTEEANRRRAQVLKRLRQRLGKLKSKAIQSKPL